MYINFDKIKFTPRQYFFLVAVSQQTAKNNMEEVIAIYLDEDCDTLKKEGYISSRKGAKKDSELSLFKITPKGKKALKDVITRSEPYDDQDVVLENWAHGIYQQKPSFQKSNREQTKRLINWFKYETEIEKNELSNLLLCFINDTFVSDKIGGEFLKEFNLAKRDDNSRLVLSNKLQNIFWTPPNRFAKFPKLEDSPLYSYYEDNKDFVDNKYKEFLNKTN